MGLAKTLNGQSQQHKYAKGGAVKTGNPFAAKAAKEKGCGCKMKCGGKVKK